MQRDELNRVREDLAAMRQAIGLSVPSVGIHQVWGMVWQASCGLLLILLSVFPGTISDGWATILFLTCWLALPAWGLFKGLTGQSNEAKANRICSRPGLYSFIVVAFGFVFVVWARLLGLAWPVIIGGLFFIEGLPCLVVSLIEPCRLSLVAWSAALIVLGLGLPFTQGYGYGILIGGVVFLGWSLAAAILYWQLRCHES